MLRTTNHIIGYKVTGTDDEIGHCGDFLFRDDDWSISYMTVDTGKWLPGKKFLVPPSAISRPDYESKSIPVSMSVQQIKGGPTIDSTKVVSVEYERKCLDYFNWPALAAASTGVGGTVIPPRVPTSVAREVEEQGNNHLRSMSEVKKYQVSASDGEIGRIDDFIIDDESWRVRYFVADTGSWMSSNRVLISPQWINAIHWADSKVDVDLTKEAIKSSPEFDPKLAINREYETRLYNYYGKPVDW